MRLLVIGRQGQLASCLAERARARLDIELTMLGRPDIDLERPETLEPAIRGAAPDVIVNAAAYTAVDQAEDEPERAHRVNSDAPGVIAAAARSAGAVLIHLSTDYVFNGVSAEAYREDAPTNPRSVYGRSKLAGEEAVRQARGDHLIVRTAWVYSAFGKNFVRTMMTLAQTRDSLSVVADQLGNPSSAHDLADGLLAAADALQRGRGGTGTYHLAGTGAASWHEFAVAIQEECARAGLPSAQVQPIATADWPTKAARPANSMLDCSRFAADFGFSMPEWRRSLAPVVRQIAETARAA